MLHLMESIMSVTACVYEGWKKKTLIQPLFPFLHCRG